MARVRGIGGIFFKSENPEALYAWYEKHLGIAGRPNEGAMFPWKSADDPSEEGMTVWSIFPASTNYFNPSTAPFMINYIVDDLDAVLAELRAAGVQVDERVERHDYGNFGWIIDPDGNRIELWEPKT
jgi:predicted enzyme related to lactoylglutathione lyase